MLLFIQGSDIKLISDRMLGGSLGVPATSQLAPNPMKKYSCCARQDQVIACRILYGGNKEENPNFVLMFSLLSTKASKQT